MWIHVYLGVFHPQVVLAGHPLVPSEWMVSATRFSPPGAEQMVYLMFSSLSCRTCSCRVTVNAGWKGPQEVSSATSR